VARGEGVVRDTAVHLRVVQEILDNARKEAYGVLGLIQSPLKGPKGNTEFLCYLEYPDRSNGCCDLMNLISSVFETVT
jgi:23S rRNA (cytidine1920-2'-O)/16S rRNA (cytidine1409-2'-O)-methyltransferase